MKHLGDITKINGAEIEPVDVITGGSPCQDLSVAGKRAGLAGTRSGLFMEQIRIVKEMRQADEQAGRTGGFIRPRYLIWENVPGAFSRGGAEIRTDDRAPTLTAAAGMSGNNQPVICAAFKAGQGAKANGIGYAEECAPTLGAVSSGTNQCPSVLIFDRAQITSPNNRSTVGPDKPCPALHTFGEVPTVCYQMQGFGDYREGDVASSCKQRDYKDSTDLVVSSIDCRNFTGGGRDQRDAASKRERRAKSEFAKHHPNRNDCATPHADGMRAAARLSGRLDGYRRMARQQGQAPRQRGQHAL